LLGGFAVNSTDKRRIRQNGVEKQSEGFLQIVEGKFFENPGKSRITGNDGLTFSVSESKKLLELHQVKFCPSMDFGECGDVAEQSGAERWPGWSEKGAICRVSTGDRALFSGIERKFQANRG
jgi:hypothetical protein